MRRLSEKIFSKSPLGFLIVLLSLLLANSVSAKMYRWVDKAGQVHYSQTIPPSQSQLGHQELNEKNGMTLNKVESSEIKKQREKEKQLLEEKNLQNKKALREELMVYMFSSKQELVEHFEGRLKMISVNIRLLQFHQKKLVNNIDDMSKQINRTKKEKQKESLKESLQASQSSLIDHSRAIEVNQKERKQVSDQMARAVKTYNKKFGETELNVGSLIGESVLDKFRGKSSLLSSSVLNNADGMCSCPCSASNSLK